MRRTSFFFIGGMTVLASGCSSEPKGDASQEPPAMADTPVVVSEMMNGRHCDSDALENGCNYGRCKLTISRTKVRRGLRIALFERPVPSDIQSDVVSPVLCEVKLPAGEKVAADLSIDLDRASDPSDALFKYEPTGSTLVNVSRPFTNGCALNPQPLAPGPLQQAESTKEQRRNDNSHHANVACGNMVLGIVSESGTFGATRRPPGWRIEAATGIDPNSSNNLASYLRNLSGSEFRSAFYDGTRLYVGNGTRLLIFNSLPTSPSARPDVILGSPDLDTNLPGTTSSNFYASAESIWSNGQKLVAAVGNRVLIWEQIPTKNYVPADVVLGQDNFSSDAINAGGIGASTLYQPHAIASDGQRLLVADTLNNRVLVWNKFPKEIGQPADEVIGQPNFESNAANTSGQSVNGASIPLYQPWGTLLDGQGAFISGLYSPGLTHVGSLAVSNPVADFTALPWHYAMDRTRIFSASSLAPSGVGIAIADPSQARVALLKNRPTGATQIDFALGQPDLDRTVQLPTNGSSVARGIAIGGTSNKLFVTDGNRLLGFDHAPTYNYEPADFVIGQAGFTSNQRVDYRGITGATLANPGDVASAGGIVAVADRSNNRVLLFRATDIAANRTDAFAVVGQAGAQSYLANGGNSFASANRLSGPGGVALDGTHLVVADTENHRVLIWNRVPTSSGTPADVVLGQSGFAANRPNHGRGDVSPADGFSDADANGFFAPTGVASDGTHLLVADKLNHRVLVWDSFPTSNDASATRVIGQPTMQANRANAGLGGYEAAANGFDLPSGVTIAGNALWVADTENNRVVRWDNWRTLPTSGAVVGQATATSLSNPNYQARTQTNVGFAQTPPTTAWSVLRPRAVALINNRLFVSESDSNRVHVFDATTLAPIGKLGQSDDASATANVGGVQASSLWSPSGLASDGTRLWVADANNHRVLGYDGSAIALSDGSASTVLGQPSMLSAGFNQSTSASHGATEGPSGLARLDDKLYIADTRHHRVIVMNTPANASSQPVRVYGQPSDTLAAPNAGGAPSARTLLSPRGVFVDNRHVIIADTGNNRVLIFDRTSASPDAALVLGQSTFAANSANAGGASARSLNRPAGVFSDGTRLYVADTGNNRVLVWNSFPTASGQAANVVLGQTNASAIFSNQGSASATASSLSLPTSVARLGGTLVIADSGNNRVVSFANIPSTSGAGATGVVGQADLASRVPASFADDRTRLAGPVGLVADATNLYVTDRDLGRILVYSQQAIASNGPATTVIGGTGDALDVVTPAGIAVDRTPYFTSRVYVSDSTNGGVTILSSVSRIETR